MVATATNDLQKTKLSYQCGVKDVLLGAGKFILVCGVKKKAETFCQDLMSTESMQASSPDISALMFNSLG